MNENTFMEDLWKIFIFLIYIHAYECETRVKIWKKILSYKRIRFYTQHVKSIFLFITFSSVFEHFKSYTV